MEQNKKGSGFKKLERTLREGVGVPLEEAGAALGEKITAGGRAAIKALTGKEIPSAPAPRNNPLEYTEMPEAPPPGSAAYGMDDDALASERAKEFREFKRRQMQEGRKSIPEGMSESEARRMRIQEAFSQNQQRQQEQEQMREQERLRARQRVLEMMGGEPPVDVEALSREFDEALNQGR
jgi:pyruvate/2-oxoglutarate dehydrogenase complex dihydrolipoamide acyltransferase (E2) component